MLLKNLIFIGLVISLLCSCGTKNNDPSDVATATKPSTTVQAKDTTPTTPQANPTSFKGFSFTNLKGEKVVVNLPMKEDLELETEPLKRNTTLTSKHVTIGVRASLDEITDGYTEPDLRIGKADFNGLAMKSYEWFDAGMGQVRAFFCYVYEVDKQFIFFKFMLHSMNGPRGDNPNPPKSYNNKLETQFITDMMNTVAKIE